MKGGKLAALSDEELAQVIITADRLSAREPEQLAVKREAEREWRSREPREASCEA